MQRSALLAFSALVLVPSVAGAHARLVWPVPRSNSDGNKTAPCGADTIRGSNPTVLTAGSQIDVRFEETITHPGWFRVSYAPVNDLEPEFMQHVILDNITHSNVGGTPRPYTQTITVPTTPCTNCTLQLVQVMTDRSPATYYYSCADITIVAQGAGVDAGGGPLDVGGPPPGPDAGPNPIDAAAQPDAGPPPDQGPVDAAPPGPDTGAVDAGAPAPPPDAGSPVDTGGGLPPIPDATPYPDATPPPPQADAGGPPNADASAGAAATGDPRPEGSIGDTMIGCRCASTAAAPPWWAAAIALGLLARRRRRR